MANLPSSLSINSPPYGGPAPPPLAAVAAAAAVAAQAKDRKMASAEQLVLDLCDPELRENALLDLSKVLSLALPCWFVLSLLWISLRDYITCSSYIGLYISVWFALLARKADGLRDKRKGVIFLVLH